MMRNVETIVRLSSTIFLGLSFLAWIIFTAGFGEFVEQIKEYDSSFKPIHETTLYAFWVASFVGPVLVIAALVHSLMFFNQVTVLIGRVIGSITVVIFILYITAIGYVMIGAGINIDEHDDENEVDRNLKASFDLLFTGGFLTTVFWAAHMAFWPWYNFEFRSNSPQTTHANLVNEDAKL